MVRVIGLILVIVVLFTDRLSAQPPIGRDIPFEFRDGLLWVRVQSTNPSRTLHFLLDTGATVSTVDEDVARELGLRLGERVMVQGVKSETEGYWPTRLVGNCGDYPLPDKILAVNLKSLGSTGSQPVDGLLGADFLKDKVVHIDFKANHLRIINGPVALTPDIETISLKCQGGKLLVPMHINHGKTQWVRLDTGCVSGLHWVVGTDISTARNTKVSVGLAPVSIPWDTTFVCLGRTEFENVPTGLHQRSIFKGEDGLLGMGLLRRFDRVTIDVPGKKLVLEKCQSIPER